MTKFALLTLALFAVLSATSGSYDANKDAMVMANRTPKRVTSWTDACDECQQIMKRVAEIAQDPTKLGELKMLLGLLCRETSYAEECHMFVNSIDRFVDRLLPYLHDPKGVCTKLHICHNSKLQQFHRVGMLYAKKYLNKVDGKNDLICEECQFAARELQVTLDNKQYQQEVREFISQKVCAHLGNLRGGCDEMLENFLPDLFQELHDMLQDPQKFCTQISMCHRNQALESNSVEEEEKVSRKLIKHFIQEQ